MLIYLTCSLPPQCHLCSPGLNFSSEARQNAASPRLCIVPGPRTPWDPAPHTPSLISRISLTSRTFPLARTIITSFLVPLLSVTSSFRNSSFSKLCFYRSPRPQFSRSEQFTCRSPAHGQPPNLWFWFMFPY